MTNLENPFSSKTRSMQEIAQEKTKQSLILLLGMCRSAKQTLLSLQKSVPNSSMVRLWQAKLDAARKEYLAFARRIGISAEAAEAELARELGEAVEAKPDTRDDVSS